MVVTAAPFSPVTAVVNVQSGRLLLRHRGSWGTHGGREVEGEVERREAKEAQKGEMMQNEREHEDQVKLKQQFNQERLEQRISHECSQRLQRHIR